MRYCEIRKTPVSASGKCETCGVVGTFEIKDKTPKPAPKPRMSTKSTEKAKITTKSTKKAK